MRNNEQRRSFSSEKLFFRGERALSFLKKFVDVHKTRGQKQGGFRQNNTGKR
jgi:hypothetical protein